MASDELLEVLNFLKRGADKSTLSQINLPFCSDTSGERSPVALLTGNINLKANLRKDGKPVSFEEELKRLEAEVANLKIKKGQVIDLSAEMKKLQIESDEKEIEIKEEWTAEDEKLLRIRKERKVASTPVPSAVSEPKNLPLDIEEMLKLAEMEDEEELSKDMNVPSKIKEIKKGVQEEKSKASGTVRELPKLKLPKITSNNPLVGDVIERETESNFKTSQRIPVPDEVSNRIILNDLKKMDLKSSVIEEEGDNSVTSESLKKPSRFSLRKK